MTSKEIGIIEDRIEKLETLFMAIVGDYPDTKLEADHRIAFDSRLHELRWILDILTE